MAGVYTVKTYSLEFDELGKGAFGIVYKGVNVTDGTPVAAKKIRFKERGQIANKVMSEMALKEAEILTQLQGHQNLVTLIEFFTLSDNHWLIMEFCELGDLAEYMQSHTVNLSGKVKVMLDTARGLEFMHSRKPPIVHRDIKPGNVLMKIEGYIIVAKLGDFGMGKLYKVDTNQLTMTTFGGTASFLAPEFFVDGDYLRYKPSIDTFALGLLFTVTLQYDATDKDSSMTPMSGILLFLFYHRNSVIHSHYFLCVHNQA